MRKTIFTVLFILGFILTGCVDSDVSITHEQADDNRTLTISAAMPGNGTSTRVVVYPNGRNLSATWQDTDHIKLFFVQNQTVVEGEETPIFNRSSNQKEADFKINIPQGINPYQSFEVVGFCGVTGNGVNLIDGKILADLAPIRAQHTNSRITVPVWFKTTIEAIRADNAVNFSHLGTYEIVHIKNTSNSEITLGAAFLKDKGGSDIPSWAHIPYMQGGKVVRPSFNPLTGNVENLLTDETHAGNFLGTADTKVAPQANSFALSWYYPKNINLPELELMVISNDLPNGHAISTNSKAAKEYSLETERAYHAYGVWDGATLTMTESDYEVGEAPSITLTTSKAPGETITLRVNASHSDVVWIDLNNNGVKDEGEGITGFSMYRDLNYEVESQTIRLYGKVTYLYAFNNELTALDVTKNPYLETLESNMNQLTEIDLSNNIALKQLVLTMNQLTEVDLTNNVALENVQVEINQLTELDVTHNPTLNKLGVASNPLTALDITHNPLLSNLSAAHCLITQIDFSQNPLLEIVMMSSNQLSHIDVTQNSKLKMLDVNVNNLTELDVTRNAELTNLYFSRTQIAEIDITQNPELKYLTCTFNELTALNVSQNPNLTNMDCRYNQIDCIQVSQQQLDNIPTTWQKDNFTIYCLDCDNCGGDDGTGTVPEVPGGDL